MSFANLKLILMKNFKTTFLLLIIVALFSCKDEEPPSPFADIEGTWMAIEDSFNMNTSSTSPDGQTIASETDFQSKDFNYELTIDDSNWTATGDYNQIAMTITDTGTLEEEHEYTNEAKSGGFNKIGDKIRISTALFNHTFFGSDFNEFTKSKDFDYEINGAGELIFSFEETVNETPAPGTTFTSTVVTASKWIRK